MRAVHAEVGTADDVTLFHEPVERGQVHVGGHACEVAGQADEADVAGGAFAVQDLDA